MSSRDEEDGKHDSECRRLYSDPDGTIGPDGSGARRTGLSDRIGVDRLRAISVSALKRNMEVFFGHLQEIVDSGKGAIGAFQVSQIEVTVQVTGDGQVCLLGTGVKMETQGGLKLVLKRTPE